MTDRRAPPSRRACAASAPSATTTSIRSIAALHGGRCTPDQVRAWVINRYYYQSRIPMKDAAFMSRVEDPALRRAWRKRIEDHDGADGREGGIAPLAAAGRGGRARSRLRRLLPRGDARDPLRRRRLRALRARGDAARGGGGVADRALRPEDPRRAHRGPARGTTPSPTTARSPTSAAGCDEAPDDVAFGLACVLDHADTRREAGRRRRGARSSRPTCSGRSSTRSTPPTSSPAASRPAPGSPARACCEAAA